MADFLPLTPAEMQVQQAAIDRQRAIAQALQQSSLQAPDGQMVSGHYVAPNPTQYLAKLAQGLIGKNQQDDLDKKQIALATQQGDMMRAQFGIGGQPQAPAPQVVQSALQTASQLAPGATQNKYLPTEDGTMAQFSSAPVYGNPGATDPNMVKAIASKLLESTPQQGQAQQSGYGSRVLPGMSPLQAFQLYNSDPKTYDAAYLKQFEPTEFSKDVKLLPAELRDAAIRQKFLPPIVNRGYGVLTTGPDGKLQNDPASMEGIDRAKAIEGRYGAPIPLKTPNGSEIQLSPTEWADFQRNGGRLPLRFLPTATQDALQNEANQSGESAKINLTTPQGTISGQVQPQSVQANQIGVGQSTAAKSEQDAYGKNLADYQKEIDEKANAAQTVKARVADMRELTKGFTSGSLTPYKEKLGGILIGMGADPDAVNSKLGNIADMQAFNKEALNMAFEMTKQLTSRPAASEVMLALKANPNLALQPDASRKIMNTIEGIADYNLTKQQAAAQYRKSYGTLDGFEAKWNANNPINKYVDFATLRSAPPQQQVNTSPTQANSKDIYDEFGLKRRK
jgi:hypothetical protein